MGFPASSLAATGGDLWSHVFENPARGIVRDHFWTISLDLDPIHYDGSTWVCSASVDWMRFDVRDWRDLSIPGSQLVLGEPPVEASFYMVEHDPAGLNDLRLLRLDGARFRISLELIVDFAGYAENDRDPTMSVSLEADISYRGLIVSRQNLTPSPASRREARAIAGSFVDLDAYLAAQEDGHRFILPPRP